MEHKLIYAINQIIASIRDFDDAVDEIVSKEEHNEKFVDEICEISITLRKLQRELSKFQSKM